MKLLTLIKAKKHGSLKKMIFLVLIMIAMLGIFFQITWSYHHLENGLGTAVAQIATMYHVVLLLILVAVGIGLGHWIDQMIRRKKFIFQNPQKGGWTEAFMNLWGYELKENETARTKIELPIPGSKKIEHIDLFNMPTRRGRRPTFPLERWLPIAARWESRDPIRDAFTLGELIAEHLGTNSDGSPIVSEQTYYSVWRQRAIEELQQRAKFRKINSNREIKSEPT